MRHQVQLNLTSLQDAVTNVVPLFYTPLYTHWMMVNRVIFIYIYIYGTKHRWYLMLYTGNKYAIFSFSFISLANITSRYIAQTKADQSCYKSMMTIMLLCTSLFLKQIHLIALYCQCSLVLLW